MPPMSGDWGLWPGEAGAGHWPLSRASDDGRPGVITGLLTDKLTSSSEQSLQNLKFSGFWNYQDKLLILLLWHYREGIILNVVDVVITHTLFYSCHTRLVSCIGYQRRYLGLMEILMLMCLPSKEWHDPLGCQHGHPGSSYLPFSALSEPLERGAKYEQIFTDFHWILGTQRSAGLSIENWTNF